MTNPLLNVDNLYCLFERQANNTPEKVAVIDSEGETNYQTLRMQSESVHAALLLHGIGPGNIVAVMMERSADLLMVMLGILRAGCTYVPLEPTDPPKRLSGMISRCNAEFLFTDAPLSVVQHVTAGVQNLTTMAPGNLTPANTNALPPIETGIDKIAYLLFTSGTTGEPKAVMVSQSNVIHLLHSAERILGMAPSDCYLAVSTVAFDASVIELFLPLVVGASLYLKDGNLLLSPNNLANQIRANGVTIMQTAPSVWAAVLKNSDDFPKLRVAITHGEEAPLDLTERLVNQAECVFNMYGPTETTVWATGHHLVASHTRSLTTPSAPIGKPLDHVRAYVADDTGQIIEGEAQGELWLGGPSVTLGYWKDKEQTQSRYQQLESDWVYKTGDLVQRSSDGTLHFLGRLDDQLQLHGVRVEPQEIEAVTRDHPEVQTAIATWFDHPEYGRQMLVATVPCSGSSLTQADLQSFLVNRIPRRIMPSCILVLAEVPLTRNGKIDKTILRNAAVKQRTHTAAPTRHKSMGDFRSPTEWDVAECWQHIIGTTISSREDQFFQVGGDSLSAVYMISEIEAIYAIELQLSCVFEYPTIRTLARHVDTVRLNKDNSIDRGFVIPIGQQNELVTPLFFCNVDLCLARKNVWTTDIPLYAVLPWSKGEGLARAASIEKMAAMLLSRIKDVQSEGPYRLGGYSFGGLLAFEIAQQLRRAGEKVEYLFLLDPTPPGLQVAALSIGERARARAKRILRGPSRVGWSAWVRTIVQLIRLLKQWLKYQIKTLKYEVVDWRIQNPYRFKWLPFPLYIWPAYAHFARPLIHQYQATPYAGRALIVACTDGHGGSSDYTKLLEGDVERLNVNTHHHLLFRDPALEKWMRWLLLKSQE